MVGNSSVVVLLLLSFLLNTPALLNIVLRYVVPRTVRFVFTRPDVQPLLTTNAADAGPDGDADSNADAPATAADATTLLLLGEKLC